jgi:hypothetical protein
VYGKINSLTRQVKEKEVNLEQERESVRALSEQLQDLQVTSSGFEALATQGKEILKRLGDHQANADEQHRKSAEELRNKQVLSRPVRNSWLTLCW